jgi:hypothetical protein
MEHAYRVIIKGQEFFFKEKKTAIALIKFLEIGFQFNDDIKIEILEIMNHDESYQSITIALKQLREEEDKSKLN